MSNLHLLLDEANKHNPKGFDPAINNTFPWKDELGLSTYREQMELPKAINFVDGTVAAPTTVDGDIYVLTGSGVIDGSWGNATFGDWVRFTNTIATEITPLTGYLCYDVTAASWMEYDGAVWAVFGGGGGNTIYTADDTIGAGRVATLTDTLEFAGGGVQTTDRMGVGVGSLSHLPATGRLTVIGLGTTTANWTFITRDSSGNRTFLVKDNGQTETKWNSHNLRDVMAENQLGVGVPNVEGNITGSARFSVRGFGATSGTTALLVQNSLGTNLLEVKDDGSTTIRGSALIEGKATITGTTATNIIDFLYENSANSPILTVSNNGNMVLRNNNGTTLMSVNNSAETFLNGYTRVYDHFQVEQAGGVSTSIFDLVNVNSNNIFTVAGNGATTIKANSGTTLFSVDATGNFLLNGPVDAAYSLKVQGNIGFYNTTPVAQGTALTTQLTTISQAGSFTPDYAIQAVTNTSPYGFVTAGEAETLISTVLNLQTRLAELEAMLDSTTGNGLIA